MTFISKEIVKLGKPRNSKSRRQMEMSKSTNLRTPWCDCSDHSMASVLEFLRNEAYTKQLSSGSSWFAGRNCFRRVRRTSPCSLNHNPSNFCCSAELLVAVCFACGCPQAYPPISEYSLSRIPTSVLKCPFLKKRVNRRPCVPLTNLTWH